MKSTRKVNFDSLKLEKSSRDWLVSCLDPYHDTEYAPTGLPDQLSAPSVVQVHNQSYALTAPTSSAGGTWDACVSYSGYNAHIESTLSAGGGLVVRPQGPYHAYDHNSLSVGAPFKSLNVWAGAAGSTRNLGAPTTIGDTYYALGSQLSTDRARLVGVAFEVTNTTAEVYRQGSVTVAQLADVSCDTSNVLYVDTNASAVLPNTVQTDRSPLYASTLPPLLAAPEARTWAAADGVYAIPRMVRPPGDTALLGSNSTGRVPTVYGTDGSVSTPEPSILGAALYPAFKTLVPSGFSPVECWFSGLSPETTLTITFRTIVEYFPAMGSALLPLAEPSPVYDPAALALYSAIIVDAPVAVSVQENPLGEYFKRIVGVLGKALSLSSPLFGPAAPVASAVGNLGTWWAERPTQPLLRKKGAGQKRAPRASS